MEPEQAPQTTGKMHVTGPINQAEAPNIPVIDYEDSQYRANFWINQGRAYEDAAERLSLIHISEPTRPY